jgi:hypothetical protein
MRCAELSRYLLPESSFPDEATLASAPRARERELRMAAALDERTSLRLSATGLEEVAGLSTLELFGHDAYLDGDEVKGDPRCGYVAGTNLPLRW